VGDYPYPINLKTPWVRLSAILYRLRIVDYETDLRASKLNYPLAIAVPSTSSR